MDRSNTAVQLFGKALVHLLGKDEGVLIVHNGALLMVLNNNIKSAIEVSDVPDDMRLFTSQELTELVTERYNGLHVWVEPDNASD